jgi:hypothetical protein
MNIEPHERRMLRWIKEMKDFQEIKCSINSLAMWAAIQVSCDPTFRTERSGGNNWTDTKIGGPGGEKYLWFHSKRMEIGENSDFGGC